MFTKSPKIFGQKYKKTRLVFLYNYGKKKSYQSIIKKIKCFNKAVIIVWKYILNVLI